MNLGGGGASPHHDATRQKTGKENTDIDTITTYDTQFVQTTIVERVRKTVGKPISLFYLPRRTCLSNYILSYVHTSSHGSFSSCLAVDLSSGRQASIRRAKSMKSILSLPSRKRVLLEKLKSSSGTRSGYLNCPVYGVCYYVGPKRNIVLGISGPTLRIIKKRA